MSTLGMATGLWVVIGFAVGYLTTIIGMTALGVVLSFAFFGFGVFEGVKTGTVICAV